MTLAAACGVALFTARGDDGAAREMERLLDACVAAEARREETMRGLRLFWDVVASALMDDVDRALQGVDPADVPGAKRAVCSWIQKRRRVPGTLRRLACRAVNAITARDVPEFERRLRDVVDG